VRHNPTILADQLGDLSLVSREQPKRCSQRSPLEVAMKARLTRLVYSLAALAALAAALGAGTRWH
jgi:hypothetical protein